MNTITFKNVPRYSTLKYLFLILVFINFSCKKDSVEITKADFSSVGHKYRIVAATNLGSDEDNNNDQVTQQLTHEHPNDIGVSAILTPFCKQVLGADEPINVVIKNYGSASQSNFDVSYSINGSTAVVELQF